MKRRFILSVILALVLTLSISLPAMALTSQDVTVTATPEYLAISNAPTTWSVGDVGAGTTARIIVATTYYTNPLGATTQPTELGILDTECRFTITNTSTVAIDLTVNFPHFTGGDAMQNSGTGSGGVGEFGAYSWASGAVYSTGKVVALITGSGVMKDALAATTDIKWGLTISTQTDVWTSGAAMNSTVTITATADV